MIDPRFYQALGPVTVRALAPSADIGGDAERLVIRRRAGGRAGPDDLCYFEAQKRGARAQRRAGGLRHLAGAAHLAPNAGALILADRPRGAFARLVAVAGAPARLCAGRAASIRAPARRRRARRRRARSSAPAREIGAGAEIGPNAVIGPGVAIGRRTTIGAGASIAFALIGDDVTILPGAVIGEQGFGVAGDASGPVDVPHLGRVDHPGSRHHRRQFHHRSRRVRRHRDRARTARSIISATWPTIAASGAASLIAAFAGISGSTVVGDGVTMGGRVGIGDHRNIGAGATLAGGAAVFQDVPAGEVWSGYPAKPLRKWLREAAWLSRKAAGARNAGE